VREHLETNRTFPLLLLTTSTSTILCVAFDIDLHHE
jgi:hypothetical protein